MKRYSYILGCLCLFLFNGGHERDAAAQTQTRQEAAEEVRKSLSTRRTYTLSPAFYEKLTVVHEAIDAGQLEDAERTVKAMREEQSLNPYEEALLFQADAALYIETDLYAEAADALEQSLKTNGLPKASHIAVHLNLGQLYLNLERDEDALAYLETWESLATIADPFGKMMLAAAYGKAERHQDAVAKAKEAISLSPEPLESWFDFLVGEYYLLEDYESAADLLEETIVRFPDTGRHLSTLASIYIELERHAIAVAVLEQGYSDGRLTEPRTLRMLANLYLHQDTPYKAAATLDRIQNLPADMKIDILRLQSSAWIEAREVSRAIPTLRAAAAASDNGELYYFLGQQLYGLQDWDAASVALTLSLERGGVAAEGQAALLLGLSHLKQDRLKEAEDAFSLAAASEVTREDARDWLTFIESSAPDSNP